MPISKSLKSCAGVTLRAPEPWSIETYLSVIISTFLSTIGTIIFFPIYFLYLVSLGLTATAVSPSIVSGLVVAMVRKLFSPSILYFI